MVQSSDEGNDLTAFDYIWWNAGIVLLSQWYAFRQDGGCDLLSVDVIPSSPISPSIEASGHTKFGFVHRLYELLMIPILRRVACEGNDEVLGPARGVLADAPIPEQYSQHFGKLFSYHQPVAQ